MDAGAMDPDVMDAVEDLAQRGTADRGRPPASAPGAPTD